MTLSGNTEPSTFFNHAEAMVMLNQNSPNETDSKTQNQPREIETRFGTVTVDPMNAIEFARGLLGIPDRFRFVLTSFPSEKMKQFKLLQCLDDDNLSFITLPIAPDSGVIETSDIVSVCNELHIEAKSLALLAIVSVHRSPEDVKLSINARAPLFIDADRKLGTQHVFQSERYHIQHMLK